MPGLIMTQGSIQQGIAKPVELLNRGRLGFYNALDRTHHHSHYQLPPGNLYASRMGIFNWHVFLAFVVVFLMIALLVYYGQKR